MSQVFEPRYFKDPGRPLPSVPPGFWIGVIIVIVLFVWLHGCKGGVSP